jgi:quercetin dioxygenase-like cupin family protein
MLWMDENPDVEPQVQHVYEFARLDRLPDGATSLEVTARRLLSGATLETGKSSTVGAVLSGRSIICTLGRQAAGTGAKAHSHPNEQFNYILHGTMMSDIEGDRVFARKGCILHTPGAVVHTGLACPDEDLVFFAMKDTRHGIVGPPVDGRYDGPNCFPGFGNRSGEPRVSTAGVIEEAKTRPPGPGKRYVYDMKVLHDENVGRPCSAAVVDDSALSLPHGVSGKVLTGERLHVCVLMLDPRARISNYRADNEQLVFVAEGEVEAMLGDEPLTLSQYSVLHIPAGVHHDLEAQHGATLVIAQDRGVA